jgi:hypothetical protein
VAKNHHLPSTAGKAHLLLAQSTSIYTTSNGPTKIGEVGKKKPAVAPVDGEK